MILEVRELSEALEAEWAGEGLLPGVDERVSLQLGRGGESLAAVAALVPPDHHLADCSRPRTLFPVASDLRAKRTKKKQEIW